MTKNISVEIAEKTKIIASFAAILVPICFLLVNGISMNNFIFGGMFMLILFLFIGLAEFFTIKSFLHIGIAVLAVFLIFHPYGIVRDENNDKEIAHFIKNSSSANRFWHLTAENENKPDREIVQLFCGMCEYKYDHDFGFNADAKEGAIKEFKDWFREHNWPADGEPVIPTPDVIRAYSRTHVSPLGFKPE